ncbi:MAG: collagen-like protein [Firmicutes bacterium]|nr:collagen-like protein [Bacillota bacterium]
MTNKTTRKLTKLIIFIVSIVLAFSMITLFTGCNDTSALERELQELRDQIAGMQNGSQGPQGPQGEQGNPGAPGLQGNPGTPGQDGITPHIGPNGNWWIGTTDTGIHTIVTDGQDGTNGITPHICENGYWWVGYRNTNIRAQGPQGNPGNDGADGQNGTDGKNGLTPHICANGYWWIGTYNTGVRAEGVGTNGITPHIGSNGNWFIGTVDTGVPARGPQGEQGSQGEQGRPGNDGADGQNGQDGLTPHICANGYWWIGSTNTGVRAQGTGGNGANGTDGADGITPHIGTNGNWWIGTQDTGVRAQGQDAPGTELNRIYQLGETFTYVSHGLELFSITVTQGGTDTSVAITIYNHRVPNFNPSLFVRMSSTMNGVNFFTNNFSSTTIAIGSTHQQGWNLHDPMIQSWFGSPIGTNSINTFAIFQLR